ncbi:MAG: OsmC family peroxiredoxin [Clostridia bacterium]|nr:OsmC family peroxiredoxin [Clostridia bacterium]
MKTSTIEYLGELRTQATHQLSGQRFITDAPPDNQGRGEAFSPTDLLATALGACAVTIMGIAAREHGFNIDGTTIDITKIMASNPRRVSAVTVVFNFPEVKYSDKEKKIIRLAANTCPVFQSLHPDMAKEYVFNFQD